MLQICICLLTLYKSARNLKFEVSADGKLYVYVESVAREKTTEIDAKKDVT